MRKVAILREATASSSVKTKMLRANDYGRRAVDRARSFQLSRNEANRESFLFSISPAGNNKIFQWIHALDPDAGEAARAILRITVMQRKEKSELSGLETNERKP